MKERALLFDLVFSLKRNLLYLGKKIAGEGLDRNLRILIQCRVTPKKVAGSLHLNVKLKMFFLILCKFF